MLHVQQANCPVEAGTAHGDTAAVHGGITGFLCPDCKVTGSGQAGTVHFHMDAAGFIFRAAGPVTPAVLLEGSPLRFGQALHLATVVRNAGIRFIDFVQYILVVHRFVDVGHHDVGADTGNTHRNIGYDLIQIPVFFGPDRQCATGGCKLRTAVDDCINFIIEGIDRHAHAGAAEASGQGAAVGAGIHGILGKDIQGTGLDGAAGYRDGHLLGHVVHSHSTGRAHSQDPYAAGSDCRQQMAGIGRLDSGFGIIFVRLEAAVSHIRSNHGVFPDDARYQARTGADEGYTGRRIAQVGLIRMVCRHPGLSGIPNIHMGQAGFRRAVQLVDGSRAGHSCPFNPKGYRGIEIGHGLLASGFHQKIMGVGRVFLRRRRARHRGFRGTVDQVGIRRSPYRSRAAAGQVDNQTGRVGRIIGMDPHVGFGKVSQALVDIAGGDSRFGGAANVIDVHRAGHSYGTGAAGRSQDGGNAVSGGAVHHKTFFLFGLAAVFQPIHLEGIGIEESRNQPLINGFRLDGFAVRSGSCHIAVFH